MILCKPYNLKGYVRFEREIQETGLVLDDSTGA